MRSLAVVVVVSLVGCASNATAPAGDDDDSDQVPPGMQPSGGGGDESLKPPAHGFQVRTPLFDLPARADTTFCYYFHTPNKLPLGVQQWQWQMAPGMRDFVVYLTRSDIQPAGTLLIKGCNFVDDGIGPVLIASATDPGNAITRDHLAMPADDGSGTPVALPIGPDQAGFIQMHYANASDAVIQTNLLLNAVSFDDDTAEFTPAAPYVAQNIDINVGPGTPSAPATGTFSGDCAVDASLKFFALTARTLKQGVHAFVKDGNAMLFDTTSWDHPGLASWATSPFYSFASGKLSYQCSYSNPTSAPLSGNNEVCFTVGLFFPAPNGAGKYCLNSNVLN